MAGRNLHRKRKRLIRTQRCRCAHPCHFPDTDTEYKNIDSKILLRKTTELLHKTGWHIGNIDATICAEHPKLNPHIEKMKEILASLMDIDISDVSLKATTTEKLGFTGREEGISTYAVALIEK